MDCDIQYYELFREVFRISTKPNFCELENNASNDSANLDEFVHITGYEKFDSNFYIEQGNAVIFDRLQMSMEELTESFIKAPVKYFQPNQSRGTTREFSPILYLFECYDRANSLASSVSNIEHIQRLKRQAIEQASLYICQRAMYLCHSSDSPVLLKLVQEKCRPFSLESQLVRGFLNDLFEEIRRRVETDQEFDQLLEDAYYRQMQTEMLNQTLDTLYSGDLFEHLSVLISNPKSGCSFIRLNSAWMHSPGDSPRDYAILHTLLGQLISISCLPRVQNYRKFECTATENTQLTEPLGSFERMVGDRVSRHAQRLQALFLELLKQGECRELTLTYLGAVLDVFSYRAKLWQTGNNVSVVEEANGFIINLCHVLLLLCKPFASPTNVKLLKISPKYTLLPSLKFGESNEQTMSKIHMQSLDKESWLVPRSEEESKLLISDPPANSYNFMSEIFFMAHKALQFTLISVHQPFLQLMQRINEMDRESARNNDRIFQSMYPQVRLIHMTKYLNLRTLLFEDNFVDLCANMCLATSAWLVNLAMHKPVNGTLLCEISNTFVKPTFEMADYEKEETVSRYLRLVPEFVAENVIDFFVFILRTLSRTALLNRLQLDPLMTFIMTFMGSPLKMKNPHLRAKLAEMLEELMPNQIAEPAISDEQYILGSLFQQHQFINHLVQTLVHVFVSIEVTGESVAFEQKFQYRRPMYIVLRYLWNEPLVKEVHRKAMKCLSNEAVRRIEDSVPPLFLRFINLLTNDAIFLLDESLQQMSKLRMLQYEKANNQWDQLSPTEKAEKERDFTMTEKLARFHNVMGNETISTLSFLTEEIKDIFCLPVMVDRITSMLNYFLMHLVGPKKGQFKVNDSHVYEFRPAETVHDICRIYANLGLNNPLWKDFCKAIKNDDRSYTTGLLPSAMDVLYRTGNNRNGLCEQIIQINAQVNEIIEEEKKEEINLNDVPDEFLDPILSCLMRNPVRLPSNYILDKSTIARHLLSDQTDPFTRQPLSMEMIKPEPELKERIDNFIKEYLRKKESTMKE